MAAVVLAALLTVGCQTTQGDESAATTTNPPPSTTFSVPVTSNSATSTTQQPPVVFSAAEPPDFDEIAQADGDIEACQAWVGWNYDDYAHGECDQCLSPGGSIEVWYPLADALQDMADCSIVGWANFEAYRQCIGKVEPVTITSPESGIIWTALMPSKEDRAHCRTVALGGSS